MWQWRCVQVHPLVQVCSLKPPLWFVLVFAQQNIFYRSEIFQSVPEIRSFSCHLCLCPPLGRDVFVFPIMFLQLQKKKKKKSWQQAVRVICLWSIGATWQCFSAPLHSHLSSCSARATVQPSGGRLLLFLLYSALIDMLRVTASVSVGAGVKSRWCSFNTWKMVQKGSSLTKAFWKP